MGKGKGNSKKNTIVQNIACFKAHEICYHATRNVSDVAIVLIYDMCVWILIAYFYHVLVTLLFIFYHSYRSDLRVRYVMPKHIVVLRKAECNFMWV